MRRDHATFEIPSTIRINRLPCPNTCVPRSAPRSRCWFAVPATRPRLRLGRPDPVHLERRVPGRMPATTCGRSAGSSRPAWSTTATRSAFPTPSPSRLGLRRALRRRAALRRAGDRPPARAARGSRRLLQLLARQRAGPFRLQPARRMAVGARQLALRRDRRRPRVPHRRSRPDPARDARGRHHRPRLCQRRLALRHQLARARRRRRREEHPRAPDRARDHRRHHRRARRPRLRDRARQQHRHRGTLGQGRRAGGRPGGPDRAVRRQRLPRGGSLGGGVVRRDFHHSRRRPRRPHQRAPTR